jgi:hypothetical protein
MKKLFIIFIIGFIIIGFQEIKSFNNTMDNIKALNNTVNACHVDMQKDTSIICD